MPALNRRQSIVLTATAFASASWGTWAQAQARPKPPALQLVLRQPPRDASLPVRLATMHVQAEVVGSVAKTLVELVFHNPNPQALEGELQFPLLEGQSVTGFALDIQGEMRNAVPVPKDKGQQVFEDVTRQRVDPALLQTTQGNNHSLRVYPIPAGAGRRVRLEITQALSMEGGGAVYRMPLAFGGQIGQLRVSLKVAGVSDLRHISAQLGARTLSFTRADGSDGVVAAFEQDKAANPEVLMLRQNSHAGPQVSAAEFRGKTYFYAELPASAQLRPLARPRPQRLGLVWDASGSTGEQRHNEAHLNLMDRYFNHIRDTEVLLRVVRDVAEPVRTFAVRNGQWLELRKHLMALVHDGATDSELLAAAPEGADLALVFTDGLFNFGRRTSPSAKQPTLVLNTSVSANAAELRQWAESSGGEYIDLSNTAVPDALPQMTQLRPRISDMAGSSVTDLVAASPYLVNGRYRVAGVLTAPRGELNVTLTDAQGRHHKHTCVVLAEHRNQGSTLAVAPHQWAAMQLNALMAKASLNARAIERLGMHFRLPTARTSLIVLENAQDYVNHDIEPPVEDVALAQAVAQLLSRKLERDHQATQSHMAQVTRDFKERQDWWEKAYPTEPKPPEPMASESSQRDARRPAMAMAVAPAPASRTGNPSASQASTKPATQPSSSIQLQPWQPDSLYARRMRAAQGDAVYQVYLDERPSHTNSTAFFLDATDILLQKQQPALAARVLSNLAEMNLESRHVLRILSQRLMQMDATAKALPVLERVLDMAPHEPQSWRDLALAQAALGQYQAAIDKLWHVVSHPWHGRFPGIEMTALGELNAIVDQARRSQHTVNTQHIPPALLKHLPLGLRVTLAWDADNTDIDLHVVDPHGEEAYFGHRFTHQGGAMSPDFTGGYGPEEFILRRPVPGKYKVRAKFFGHAQQVVSPYTTLMLQLFTGFGTPEQKLEQVVLRLSGRGEMIDVGEFEIFGTGAAAR